MPDPDVALTLAEAVAVLNPPMTVRQLRLALQREHIAPCGQRFTGRDGRPANTYPAAAIMRIHLERTRSSEQQEHRVKPHHECSDPCRFLYHPRDR